MVARVCHAPLGYFEVDLRAAERRRARRVRRAIRGAARARPPDDVEFAGREDGPVVSTPEADLARQAGLQLGRTTLCPRASAQTAAQMSSPAVSFGRYPARYEIDEAETGRLRGSRAASG
jgi:hypothetical protein